ncbi:MAG: NusG domain II-containing protein [Clostridium sp.]|nr:NusG domain II-containing protein [Clostridium sp.]
MNKIRKDIILLSGILLTAFLAWLLPTLINKGRPAVVKVYQEGQETAVYPLTGDLVTAIPWGEEHYNLLLIDGGKVSVSDADCPDQLCVKQRSISNNGESIICLPHKLVLQIESEKEGELDAVTY